jgi:hypothetical protein
VADRQRGDRLALTVRVLHFAEHIGAVICPVREQQYQTVALLDGIYYLPRVIPHPLHIPRRDPAAHARCLESLD